MALKQRVIEILDNLKENDKPARIFSAFISTVIFLNVIAIILESERTFAVRFESYFKLFEVACVAIFTIEYILRMWSCTAIEKFSHPFYGRIRYAMQFYPIVDLVSILPFYLPFLLKVDLRFIRVMRLFRMFRILKLARYSNSLQMMGRVFKSRKEQILLTSFMLFIVIIMASCVIYLVEYRAQPDRFSSIPATMWWTIATITTIGYGDLYPVTALGKFLGSIIALIGIGMFAVPTAIIGSGFMEEMQREKKAHKTCPHCGKELDA
ncbi:MAG: hypothetical protein A2297_00995 [Elusimicrobia bacterium RIFOXYB2_FULL_48_7]|nr:MAG: hypothetical protein A2297_00995 [Elusimicrobia bacterium RIFOXYB2_FULL_48_7]